MTTLVFIIGGLLGYSLVKSGYFPIAKVNGELITMKNIKDNIDVSKRLYEAGLISGDDVDSLFKSGEDTIFKNALESLIVNIAIKTSASAEVREMALDRVESYLAEVDVNKFNSSLKSLYGWDIEKFRQRILEPQAFNEALAEEHGDDYKEKFMDIKNSVDVSIWFIPFEWRDGSLMKK